MLGSVVLDLAIGMAFIYLLLSLIVSVLQEMLAALAKSRSAILQRGLNSLFSGDSVVGGKSVVNSIYDHGLIRGLYQDPQKDNAGGKRPVDDTGSQGGSGSRETANGLPRWTRFRLWVQCLIGVAPGAKIQVVSDPTLLPSYIPARTFALALIDILNQDKANGQPLQNIRKLLVDTLHDHPENKAAEAIVALANDARNDIVQFQKNLENWFNDSMDRVSGWYKAHTQGLLFVIGLAIAIVFNVDSIRVARTLWVDRDMRQGMVAAASDYMQHNPPPAVQQTQDNGQAESVKTLASNMRSSVQAFRAVANESLLPIGWVQGPRKYWKEIRADFPSAAMDGSITFVGWLITAAALSLGAPFWFDTLSRFMTVRSSIKPQEQNPDQDS